MWRWSQCAPVEDSSLEGVIEETWPWLETQRKRAFGAALHLQGLRAGAVAEAEGHHPDLFLAWGKCKIEIWSHKIKGLTESDFVLAAKAEQKFKPFRTPA
jgi:pterin-4a-carbinolamine dehydratase